MAATPDGSGYWILRPRHPRPHRRRSAPAPAALRSCSLQQQLYALGYWVDTTGGVFDDSTEQAVYTLAKGGRTADRRRGRARNVGRVPVGGRPAPTPHGRLSDPDRPRE